ncbi:MAG: hypothetical protein HOP33_06825 [Verrucomicrobia bacterium]|nr:hypothetical protein [Verrucomicrobiota bacterium]
MQGKITTALQPRFPNIRWSARKEKVAEIQAAVLSGSGSGLEQEIVQYVNNGLNYSIALNATSKRDFQTAEPTFRRFLSSFTMLEGGKSLSDSDRRAAQVARLKRLASLREQMGQLADALQLADEGLSIDPNDAGLKEIRQRLVSKR